VRYVFEVRRVQISDVPYRTAIPDGGLRIPCIFANPSPNSNPNTKAQ